MPLVDSLSPVGELHHEVEHCQHHQEVEEGVAVCHCLFLIVTSMHGPLAPVLTIIITPTITVICRAPYS